MTIVMGSQDEQREAYQRYQRELMKKAKTAEEIRRRAELHRQAASSGGGGGGGGTTSGGCLFGLVTLLLLRPVSNDPPPRGLVKRAVAKVVRTQRKAVAQRPKKKGAK